MKTDIYNRNRIVALLCTAAVLLGLLSLSACNGGQTVPSPDTGTTTTSTSTGTTHAPFPENRVVPDVFEGLVYRKPGTRLVIDSTYAPDYPGEANTVEFYGRDDLVSRRGEYPSNISDEMAFWLDRESADDTRFRVEMAYSPYALLSTVQTDGRSLMDMAVAEVLGFRQSGFDSTYYPVSGEAGVAVQEKIRETQLALVTEKYSFTDLDIDPFAVRYSALFTATLSRKQILEMAADKDLYFLHIGFLPRPDGTPERISTELMYKLLEMEDTDTLQIQCVDGELVRKQPEEGSADFWRQNGETSAVEVDRETFSLTPTLLPTAHWDSLMPLQYNHSLQDALETLLMTRSDIRDSGGTGADRFPSAPPIVNNYFTGFRETLTKQEILALLNEPYARYLFLSDPPDNNFCGYDISF